MSRIRAPELAPAVTWLNCVRPLTLRELRGQVVVLDFWTYCCINCIHTLPVLHALEQRFAGLPLVIIGIHSAKFPNETQPDRITDAIARHAIDHPVVVDDDLQIWSRYAIRSWPTLVVVRPDGTIASATPGEPDLEALARELEVVIADARVHGTLASRPFDFHDTIKPATGTLRFPGKAALSPDGRLAIADSGHNRVLVCAADGTIQARIGSGERGNADGPFSDARFDNPQGLAWDRGTLWICDTQNHRVCRADLDNEEVSTIAGAGTIGRQPLAAVEDAETALLRSPWDVTVDETRLYVALAGSHQIAVIDLHPDGGITGAPVIDRLAGAGSEGLRDGPPGVAFFAQPSGIVRDGKTLLVVDSESSAVRCVALGSAATSTLVGKGLFDFGHEDGPLADASLQHPLGLARATDGTLVIADTYNDSLRRLDPLEGTVSTIFAGDGEHRLREPGDVVVTPGGDFLVVDTGHHRIVRLARDGAWKGELAIDDPAPTPAKRTPSGKRPKPPPVVDALPLHCEPIGPGRGELRLHLGAPEGWRFNAENSVQLCFTVTRQTELIEIAEQRKHKAEDAPELVVSMTVITRAPEPDATNTDGEVRIDVDAVLCLNDNPGACVPARGRFRLEMSLTGTSPCDLDVILPLKTYRGAS